MTYYHRVVRFLVDHVKRYPVEICQVCKRPAFPADPAEAVHDEHAAAHVERVYCSHIYHHDCLILYLKSPPFDGKQSFYRIFSERCIACSVKLPNSAWICWTQMTYVTQ